MENTIKKQKVADTVGEFGCDAARLTAIGAACTCAGVGARAIAGKAVTSAVVAAAKSDLRIKAVIVGIGLLTWAGAKAYKWAVGYKAAHEEVKA